MTTVTGNENQKLEDKIDKLSDKLDKVFDAVNQLAIGQARLEEKASNIEKRLDKIETSQETLTKDVADLKGAKSLIVPLIVAVATSLLTLLIRAIPGP